MAAGMETRTALRWFWAWNASEEERWLEDMARQGWHLERGGILFRFRRGEPATVRYRLDCLSERGGELSEYLTLCRDAGWSYVTRFGPWYYFRTSDASAPELHTDPSTLASRYRRLLLVLIILLVSNLVIFATQTHPRGSFQNFYEWIQLIRFGLVALLAYGAVRIALFIRKLESQSSQRG